MATVCDLVAGLPPTNLTNTAGEIDDDASWSPDGQKILWTAHDPNVPNYDPFFRFTQEIYVMNADGSGRFNLTNTAGVEERGSFVVAGWHPHRVHVHNNEFFGATPIKDGVVNGNDVSFKLTFAGAPDGDMTISYTGTVKGDELALTSKFEGAPPGGGPAEQSFTAKRAQ